MGLLIHSIDNSIFYLSNFRLNLEFLKFYGPLKIGIIRLYSHKNKLIWNT